MITREDQATLALMLSIAATRLRYANKEDLESIIKRFTELITCGPTRRAAIVWAEYFVKIENERSDANNI